MQTVRERLTATFKGQSVDQLTIKFGAPTVAVPLQSGGKHYTFTLGAFDEVSRDKSGGTVTPISCKVLAIVDANGRIERMGTTDVTNQLGESYCSKALGYSSRQTP